MHLKYIEVFQVPKVLINFKNLNCCRGVYGRRTWVVWVMAKGFLAWFLFTEAPGVSVSFHSFAFILFRKLKLKEMYCQAILKSRVWNENANNAILPAKPQRKDLPWNHETFRGLRTSIICETKPLIINSISMLPGYLHLYSDVRLLVCAVESGLTPEDDLMFTRFYLQQSYFQSSHSLSPKGYEGDTVQPIISRAQILKMG